MRRYLVFLLCFICCLSLFVIPAFASNPDSYTIDFQDGAGGIETILPTGTYRVVLNVDGEYVPLENNTLVVTSDNEEHFFRTADGSGNKLFIRLYGTSIGTYVDFMDSDEVQIQGSIGFVRIEDPSVPNEPDYQGNFFADVGEFFTYVIGSLGSVLSVIVSRPILFVMVISIPIVGFAVALFSRIKSL